MRTSIIIIIGAAVGLSGGCGQVSTEDDTTATTELTRAAPPTVAVTTAPPTPDAPTAQPTTAPTGAPTPTTIRTTTTRPATTTTRPLTRAEATSNLCTSVASADEAIQRGNFVAGGLRLSSAIGRNEKAADAAVLAAARSMLRSGLNGDAEGYVTARSTASTACARAGYPIQLSGPIMCVQAPCP